MDAGRKYDPLRTSLCLMPDSETTLGLLVLTGDP